MCFSPPSLKDIFIHTDKEVGHKIWRKATYYDCSLLGVQVPLQSFLHFLLGTEYKCTLRQNETTVFVCPCVFCGFCLGKKGPDFDLYLWILHFPTDPHP